MEVTSNTTNNAKAKKEEEEYFLGKFVSNKAIGKIISSIRGRETPDFEMNEFIDDRFKSIGVEITRVFNPSLKSSEDGQNKIVKRAKLKFAEVCAERLVVYVDFTSNPFSLKNGSLNVLALELFKIVYDVAKRNEGCEYRVKIESSTLKHKVFNSITIRNDLWENWQPHGAFIVPYIDEEWFARIISKKEEKIALYDLTFEEKWLVLMANFGHESSAFQFPQLKDDFKHSKFDHIYIYKYFEDSVIQVK